MTWKEAGEAMYRLGGLNREEFARAARECGVSEERILLLLAHRDGRAVGGDEVVSGLGQYQIKVNPQEEWRAVDSGAILARRCRGQVALPEPFQERCRYEDREPVDFQRIGWNTGIELTHRECGGTIRFGSVDSFGDPSMARCSQCDTFWRRAYNWEPNR